MQPMSTPSIVLPADQTKFVSEAVTEWKQLSQGREWKGWVKVGAALDIGARAAMFAAGTNQRQGRRYNTIFSQWCRDAGFGDMPAALRSKLLYLQQEPQRTIADQLRRQWSLTDRLKRTNPQTMCKYVDWEMLRGTAKDDTKEREALLKALTPPAQANEAIAKLDFDPSQVVNHWLQHSTVDQIAQAIMTMNDRKIRTVLDQVKQRIDDADQF